MLQCIIIDDEPLACEVLEAHMRRLDYCRLVKTFHNAKDALTFLQGNMPDVLLLDIEMPEMTGIELLTKLHPQPPLTVFTTAYRDYAFEGYELGVIDFY